MQAKNQFVEKIRNQSFRTVPAPATSQGRSNATVLGCEPSLPTLIPVSVWASRVVKEIPGFILPPAHESAISESGEFS